MFKTLGFIAMVLVALSASDHLKAADFYKQDCGIGRICVVTSEHEVDDNYTVTYDGYTSKVKTTYSVTQSELKEDGRTLNASIKNIDVKEVIVQVTLNNCDFDQGGCATREFERYLTSQGATAEILWKNIFAGSAETMSKELLARFTKDNYTLTDADVLGILKNVYINLQRPLYIMFKDKNGKVLSIVKIGRGLDGKLKILADVTYGINASGQDIIHGSAGYLSQDDFFRDYTFVFHRVKDCSYQTVTITDPDGTTQQVERYACIYSSIVEFKP